MERLLLVYVSAWNTRRGSHFQSLGSVKAVEEDEAVQCVTTSAMNAANEATLLISVTADEMEAAVVETVAVTGVARDQHRDPAHHVPEAAARLNVATVAIGAAAVRVDDPMVVVKNEERRLRRRAKQVDHSIILQVSSS